MTAEPVSTPAWTSEAIADVLDEFGVTHSWILLQIDLIAANRSMVTNVLIGRLATVQHTVGDLQDVASRLAALDPARLYAGLEVLADRINRARVAAATPRPALRVHDGGLR